MKKNHLYDLPLFNLGIIMFVVLVLTAGCRNDTTTKHDVFADPVISGDAQELTGNVEGAYLQLDKKRYDFGKVKRKKTPRIDMEFEVTNIGKIPLIILKADVSCGCLSVDFSKKPIRPGEKVAMREEQRHELWMTKLNDILLMGWNQEEMEHIGSIISFIAKNKILFSNFETEQNKDQFELFMYSWIEYAEEVLYWDRETIYSICGDPNKAIRIATKNSSMKLIIPKASEYMIAVQPSVIKTRSEGGSGGGSGMNKCSCSQLSDWCDIFGDIPDWVISCNSYNYNCDIVKKNCGIFWQFDCDGICKAPIA